MNSLKTPSYFIVILCLTVQLAVNVETQETFTNPIFDGRAADPFVRKIGDFYYLVLSTNLETDLTVYKSEELTNFRNTESKVIFTVPIGYEAVWAAEMHFMHDGGLYIYFGFRPNVPDSSHRMYAMKADDPNNPMGSWGPHIRIMSEFEEPAVDGTILKHGNGRIYFVWPVQNRLHVTEMTDPLTVVTENRVQIREPSRPWECGILEGVFFIYNQNVSYLVFTACFTFGPDYNLGLMSIDGDKDPMVVSNWWSGEEHVFWRNDDEDVYGPGHPSFTVSPDETETWMVYHAWSTNPLAGFDNRIARLEKITWAEDGKPVFPRPHGYFSPQPLPSGQRVISTKTTFTNPLLNVNSADPCITLVDGNYYLTVSTKAETQLTLYKSRTLTNFRNTDSSVIFTVPPGYGNVWASEMHIMPDGELYIYFCMSRETETHRSYVMKADDPLNPLGSWGPHIRLMPDLEIGAIDLTPFHHSNGKSYFIWSQFPELYIAEMVNPTTVSDNRIHLRSPSSPWEAGVNEGPFVIHNLNVSYLVFAAAGSFGPDYCLGLMSINADKDPLNTEDWWYGDDRPVFWRNDESSVYGPGHAAFTTSPDGTETWMVYHASVDRNNFVGHRIARVDKITWGRDGKPIFPRPHGFFDPQPLPSGERI